MIITHQKPRPLGQFRDETDAAPVESHSLAIDFSVLMECASKAMNSMHVTQAVPRIHYDTQDAAARAFFVYLVGAVFAHDPEAGERLARALDFGHIVSR